MAIIIDFNQVVIANLMSQRETATEDLIRHTVLSTLLYYKKTFSEQYGEMIIACDSGNYWRKDIFPYYKAGRKKARDASDFDWKTIFDSLTKLRSELRENFPYKVLQVDKLEADDIIASLAKYFQTNELRGESLLFDDGGEPQKVLIVSSDKDFLQLQKYKNVEQYSPMQKRKIKDSDPLKGLIEKIIRGDAGDGVPNILSPDNVFVTEGIRQSGIREKKLVDWLNCKAPEDFCDADMLVKYNRNKALIDLSMIPTKYEDAVIACYKAYPKKEKSVKTKVQFLKYFTDNKLKYLMEQMNEF